MFILNLMFAMRLIVATLTSLSEAQVANLSAAEQELHQELERLQGEVSNISAQREDGQRSDVACASSADVQPCARASS